MAGVLLSFQVIHGTHQECWGYQDVLPAVKRWDHWELDNSSYHGSVGPLHAVRTMQSRQSSYEPCVIPCESSDACKVNTSAVECAEVTQFCAQGESDGPHDPTGGGRHVGH